MPNVLLPPRSTAIVVFESAASIVLVLLAVIGNVFILVALHRNPRLRNTTNAYIMALAVTDLLNACIPGTLFASTMVAGRLVYSLPACRLSGFLVHFLAYVSMTTMTLTAVNRYFRVVKSQHYKKYFGGKRLLFMLGCLWLLIASFVLYPTVTGLGEFNFNPAVSLCAYTFASRGAETVFTLIVIFILVVLCLSIVCFSYYHVSKTIREHNAGVVPSLGGVSVQEIALSKVLFVLAFAFALCWLPTFLVIFIIRIIIRKAPHGLAVVIPFLLQTTSVLNPLIYGALSPPFQREFCRLLSFKKTLQLPDDSHQLAPVVETTLTTGQSLTDVNGRERIDKKVEPRDFQHAVTAWL